MALAVVYSRAADGIRSPLVSVEVHVSNGLPALNLVGLPETAVKESKDRVRAALVNSRFEFPAKRITINLAPADLPKEGARFDLAIALGILAATGQIPQAQLKSHEFVGELALSGEVRPVAGVLPSSLQTNKADRSFVVPVANAGEAALVDGAFILPVTHLLEVCAYLRGQKNIEPHRNPSVMHNVRATADMADVRGQYHAKRALEIAAAGRHSMLMSGPPGTGKTMLASRLPGILTDMSREEATESAAIQSISHTGFKTELWKTRPFRAPHHTASAVALVGGGSFPRPGEISLSHHGVLFLDELPEFDRRVLEVLREPIESGQITISRAARQVSFPARFQLIAAMNPCPCGYLGDSSSRCRCTAEQVLRYRNKLSGPLLDRIDMHIEMQRPPSDEMLNSELRGESSELIRARVTQAYTRQTERQGKPNSALSSREVESQCALTTKDKALVLSAIERMQLSMRAYQRILKVARTIADLENNVNIETPHLTQALGYRCLDRDVKTNYA